MPKLEFSQSHRYEPGADGIIMPVTLKSGREMAERVAYLDGGANNCLFERRHGELLKLEIEAGDRRIFRSATGAADAFGHLIEAEIDKNLLRRMGWLDRIRLGLADHDGELRLAPYDYPSV